MLRAGADMKEVIRKSYLKGLVSLTDAEEDIENLVEDVVRQIRTGEATVRTVKGAEGKMFEARDFKLGTHHYASVRVDMTRLHAQQDIIKAQSQKLAVANDQLHTFASITAHDLTAPLNQQRSLIEFILEDIEEARISLPDEIREHLVDLTDLSERMAQMIKDLLHYSKDEEGGEVQLVPNPSERLNEVVKLVNVKDGFQIVIDEEMPALTVNVTVFDTIMRNLISNAIKHHDLEEGHIQVSSHLSDEGAVILVKDDGPGIPEQYREAIFEPFKRLSAKVDGSGLGLSYIQKTITAIGGTITVDAAQPRGSIFTITFPQQTKNELHFAKTVQNDSSWGMRNAH